MCGPTGGQEVGHGRMEMGQSHRALVDRLGSDDVNRIWGFVEW